MRPNASALSAYLRDMGVKVEEEEVATAAGFLADLLTPWTRRVMPPLDSTPSL